jgi:hypothetical protein
MLTSHHFANGHVPHYRQVSTTQTSRKKPTTVHGKEALDFSKPRCSYLLPVWYPLGQRQLHPTNHYHHRSLIACSGVRKPLTKKSSLQKFVSLYRECRINEAGAVTTRCTSLEPLEVCARQVYGTIEPQRPHHGDLGVVDLPPYCMLACKKPANLINCLEGQFI